MFAARVRVEETCGRVGSGRLRTARVQLVAGAMLLVVQLDHALKIGAQVVRIMK